MSERTKERLAAARACGRGGGLNRPGSVGGRGLRSFPGWGAGLTVLLLEEEAPWASVVPEGYDDLAA